MAHQRTAGVVAMVKGEGNSKSRELSEALAANKQIIACTLQTFPFTLQHLRRPGGGMMVRDKHRESLDAIIQRVNEIFVGHISDNDKLVYVNDVIMGKLMDCELRIEQAANNTKEQFANSPDLDRLILDAIMDAMASFTSMSTQALESARIRAELKDILLGPDERGARISP